MFHYSREQLGNKIDQLKEVQYQREHMNQREVDEAYRFVESALLVIERRKRMRHNNRLNIFGGASL